MHIFPAIDLFDGKAVRLLKGDYNKMTIYSDKPDEFALDFQKQGAKFLHLVDLEGAKSGGTPNIDSICKIISAIDMFTEVGGGIRSMEVIDTYIRAGVNRVILGTAAVTNPEFLLEAVKKYGDKIAVGVDLKDGYVAIHGWTESSKTEGLSFCKQMQEIGVKTIICTDISKDGAMQGTNLDLYKKLSESLDIQIVASGGVSSLADVKRLADMHLYGAIVGKAYYTNAFTIKDAIEVAK